ncbi:unnamed protein product [Amoebophrya sp. A120]|nr:unnamed protein product [Amoebophrya sp. A120]|eukprot:GSA120T00004678001.1
MTAGTSSQHHRNAASEMEAVLHYSALHDACSSSKATSSSSSRGTRPDNGQSSCAPRSHLHCPDFKQSTVANAPTVSNRKELDHCRFFVHGLGKKKYPFTSNTSSMAVVEVERQTGGATQGAPGGAHPQHQLPGNGNNNRPAGSPNGGMGFSTAGGVDPGMPKSEVIIDQTGRTQIFAPFRVGKGRQYANMVHQVSKPSMEQMRFDY